MLGGTVAWCPLDPQTMEVLFQQVHNPAAILPTMVSVQLAGQLHGQTRFC